MEMTPLALVILLAFGLILAASLTVWTAIRAGTSATDSGERGEGAEGDSGRVRGNSQRRGQERGQEREPGREQHRGQGLGQVRERRRSQEDEGGHRAVEARNVADGDSAAAPDEGEAGNGDRPAGRGDSGERASSVADSGNDRGRSSSRSDHSRSGKEGGRRKRGESDAFERFLETRPDDMDFG